MSTPLTPTTNCFPKFNLTVEIPSNNYDLIIKPIPLDDLEGKQTIEMMSNLPFDRTHLHHEPHPSNEIPEPSLFEKEDFQLEEKKVSQLSLSSTDKKISNLRIYNLQTNPDIADILQRHPDLRSICFSRCQHLKSDQFKLLKHDHIEEITFYSCPVIDEFILPNLLRNMKNVHRIIFLCCENITFNSFINPPLHVINKQKHMTYSSRDIIRLEPMKTRKPKPIRVPVAKPRKPDIRMGFGLSNALDEANSLFNMVFPNIDNEPNF